MQNPFKPFRLPHFFKPTTIMLGSYAFVHLIGFFMQHDFSNHDPLVSFGKVETSAKNYAVFEIVKPGKTSPAPPEIKLNPHIKILPSGETEEE
jgi:hypothetical protein